MILITGASSDIGADAASHFARLGGHVAFVGRSEKKLSDVVEKIKKDGSPTPLAISADVEAQRIVDETIKQFGKLDVLVNNVGIVIQSKVPNLDMTDFDRVLDTNVRSVIILTQLCTPFLEKTKGNVVVVSSIAGFNPQPNLTKHLKEFELMESIPV